jgi:hypothetical protein
MIEVTAAIAGVAPVLQCLSHWRRASAMGSNGSGTRDSLPVRAGRGPRAAASPLTLLRHVAPEKLSPPTSAA